MIASAHAARSRAVIASSRRVFGCSTCRPRSSAKRLTGLTRSRRPRPAGRSGWVSTTTMLCPASRSRTSERSAKAGVPAKIRRRNASGGLAQLLGEPSADALLLELRQVFDENLALQMIHLVLDAHGEQALRLEREDIAVLVVGAHFHAFGTRYKLIDAGQ